MNSQLVHSPVSTHLISAQHVRNIYPSGMYAHIVSTGLVSATPEIAHHLGIEYGETVEVIRRERHRMTVDSGVPISKSVSWFPAQLANDAPLLLECQRIPGGTTLYISENARGSVTSCKEAYGVSLLNESDAALFARLKGQPVLSGECWIYDGPSVIEYGQFLHAPGSTLLFETELS